MLLEPSEAGELVTDLDDAVLIRFEEEADIAMIYYWYAFVFGGFFGCQLHVSVHPSLSLNVSFETVRSGFVCLPLSSTVPPGPPVSDSTLLQRGQSYLHSTLCRPLFRSRYKLFHRCQIVGV